MIRKTWQCCQQSLVYISKGKVYLSLNIFQTQVYSQLIHRLQKTNARTFHHNLIWTYFIVYIIYKRFEHKFLQLTRFSPCFSPWPTSSDHLNWRNKKDRRNINFPWSSPCLDFFCSFVLGLSSHSRIFHSYGDVTITGDDLCSTLMAIEQWVSHLLWHWASV